MSRSLPEFINPLRFAESGKALQGEIPLRSLKRLAETLAQADGTASVKLVFGKDADGRPIIQGHIGATLELICQRCLGNVRVPLDLDVRLGIVTSEGEAERLPETLDALMVEDAPVSVRDIVEDELILALPIVPRHPLGECEEADRQSQGYEDETKPANPFAVLRDLKR